MVFKFHPYHILHQNITIEFLPIIVVKYIYTYIYIELAIIKKIILILKFFFISGYNLLKYQLILILKQLFHYFRHYLTQLFCYENI